MISQVMQFGSLLTDLAAGNPAAMAKAGDIGVKVGKRAYDSLKDTSLGKSGGRSLISPMVAIERDLVHQEYATDLMTVVMLRDIKDALAHLSLQGEVNGINIGTLVASINPRRQGGMLALSGVEAFGVSGMEAIDKKKAAADDRSSPTVTIAGKDYGDLTTINNLAVGRTVIAQVQLGDNLVPIPLNFRETPVPVSARDLELIFTAAKPKDGFYARIAMHESGEITSPEFLTGIDEIKEQFKIRTNDMSGYYEEATARQTKNRMASFTSGVMSMNTLANTIILTQETARQLELELGIRFDKRGIDKIREKVLANNIVIVDDGEGIVTFFSSSNNMPEVYTLRQLSVMSKKDTSLDLAGLMKMFGGR